MFSDLRWVYNSRKAMAPRPHHYVLMMDSCSLDVLFAWFTFKSNSGLPVLLLNNSAIRSNYWTVLPWGFFVIATVDPTVQPTTEQDCSFCFTGNLRAWPNSLINQGVSHEREGKSCRLQKLFFPKVFIPTPTMTHLRLPLLLFRLRSLPSFRKSQILT